MKLKDKVAVVTGAGRGIGHAIALKLAEEGARILLVGRSVEPLQATAEEIKAKFGASVELFSADVGSAAEATACIAKAQEVFGRIDILVNNAGVTRDTLLIRMSEDQWDEVMRINLKGAFLLSQAVAKIMMKQRTGSIINISSVVGLMGNAGQCNYSASKAGMIAFTKSAARELAPRGVRVNAVAPGFIISQMTDCLPDSIKKAMLKAIPLNRFGVGSDIANAVSFLASDDASYITGQTLSVNGGMFM